MMIVPTIQMKSQNFAGDIFSAALNNRIVFIEGQIDSAMATAVNASLLYLESVGSEPIQLYISSGGGEVTSGLAIYDTIRRIILRSRIDVITVCSGLAASMAAVILSGGSKRYALPHSEIMIHQPSSAGGIQGRESDIRVAAAHISRTRDVINEILAENCRKSVETISRDTECDRFMSASEAKEYGIIDDIL